MTRCASSARAWRSPPPGWPRAWTPQRVTFYRQSDIPETTELNWLLTCVTAKGLMNRAHAYKAAVDANEAAGETRCRHQHGPVLLPDPDVGRHPDVQCAPGARRPGPGAAHRDGA
ncbi:MAG: hypothetical protein QM765_11690 [Myxococcales bacterium]